MAFALDAIVESTTQSLSDGAPFTLLSARGMAGPPIRRITARGPAQHGDTDLGYRLQPREIELEIGFAAATDAILDGYRDTLASIFKPLTSTPVNLRVTRDGPITRQIDVYTVGPIDISLVPEFRPGHYHRATVRLRAPDPTWYDPVSGTASVQGNPITADNWYLAGGAIGTARVMMSGTIPAVGEVWSYSGTLGSASSWTMAWRGEADTSAGSTKYAFYHVIPANGPGLTMAVDGNGYFIAYNQSGIFSNIGPSLPSGTTSYFERYDGSGVAGSAGEYNALTYYDPVSETLLSRKPSLQIPYDLDGTVRIWRAFNTAGALSWGKAITQYALYSPGLTDEEIATLNAFMIDLTDTVIYDSTFVQLQGDMPDYPTIRITGPITGPTVSRVGDPTVLLAFGTATTIGAGTVVEIDTRHGYKTVLLNGSVNLRGSLQPTSNLGDWHLSADNVEGINSIVMYGENTGTATKLEVIYHHRFSSF